MTNFGNRLADVEACEAAELDSDIPASEVALASNDVDADRAGDDREDNGETGA